VADVRDCEQCGNVFPPRREHARFCSARCRVAWNRQNTSDPAAQVSALNWSITAMRDTTKRFPRITARDRPRGFAVIGEAVWWVTIVDATLVRHHPDAYDRVLADQTPTERQLIEETLAGLRHVRNQISHDLDHVDFIRPVPIRPGDDRITAWTWNPVPEPALASLSPRGQAWEMTRYRAYQARLVGHTVGEVFGTAVAFLELATAKASSDMQVSAGLQQSDLWTGFIR
jgi:hypothetical protein